MNLDHIKSFIDSQKSKDPDSDLVRKIAELTAECALKNEMLRDGFDLMNAVMLRTGLVFKINDPELAPLIAKAKAWNLRLRETDVVNVVRAVIS